MRKAVRFFEMVGNKDIEELYDALKKCQAKKKTIEGNLEDHSGEINSKTAEIEQIERNKTRMNDERANLKSLVITHQETMKKLEDGSRRIANRHKQKQPSSITAKNLRQFR